MSNKTYIEKPWEKYYKLNNIEDNLTYPEGSIYDELKKSSNSNPNNIAYEYMNIKVTYKKFLEDIESCAKALKYYGITSDDIVTICMPNTPQAITMFYAINMIGAISNMIHPSSGEKEIEKYLQDTGSKFILTIDTSYKKIINIIENTKVEKIILTSLNDPILNKKQSIYQLFKSNLNPVKKIRRFMMKIFDNIETLPWKKFIEYEKKYKYNPETKKTAKEPATILYSGGSSGIPKGILLSNLNFNALAYQSSAMDKNLSNKDSILSIMPIFHGLGLGICVHTPLVLGMKVILIPKLENNEIVSIIKNYKPTVLVGVPTLFESLVNITDTKKTDLKSLKLVICGGDTISTELEDKTNKYLSSHGSSTTLIHGYGLTESVAATSVTLPNIDKKQTIGIPFPDTYYKIVKIGTHDEAGINSDGEICLSGPTVMLGYYNDPKETMQTIRRHEDGKLWLHTGDIGSMDKDGFIYFKTRLKRIIVSSGYNLYPKYIEDVLSKHKAVFTAIVIGVKDEYKGQHAKAYIILNKGYEENEELKQSIYNHCEKYLSKYSIPSEFEFKKELPTTLIGKISYTELEK